MIADVTLQNGGIVVVTGKGYGATNFIAMDRAGEILMDRIIQVEGPTDRLSRSIAASNASRIAACRFVSGGLRWRREAFFRAASDQAGVSTTGQWQRLRGRQIGELTVVQAIASETLGRRPHRRPRRYPVPRIDPGSHAPPGKWLAAG